MPKHSPDTQPITAAQRSFAATYSLAIYKTEERWNRKNPPPRFGAMWSLDVERVSRFIKDLSTVRPAVSANTAKSVVRALKRVAERLGIADDYRFNERTGRIVSTYADRV